jgi:hypothetical protein
MSDPTIPATPEEPAPQTPASETPAPETPIVPEPAAAEPASPAVASDPLHVAQTEAPSATPYVAPDAPAAPAAPAANPYATPAAAAAPAASTGGKSPVLSIISLVAGIIGIVGFAIVFIPFIGGVLQLFIPAAAVVLGFLGKAKEPFAPKGLWLTGVILGFVGIGIALLSLLLWTLAFSSYTYY